MISIIIPVYNEEKTIKKIITDVKTVISENNLNAEIIVVDDGSKDKSVEIISKIEVVNFIRNPYNLGYGASIKKGIKNAKGDIILTIDGDDQHNPQDIPRLLESMGDFDMVVGARQNKIIDQAIFRRTGRIILSIITYFLIGQRIPDLNSGFRAFKKEIALKFFNLLPKRFSLTTTITICALTNEYTIKYIPIKYLYSKSRSSIRPIKDFTNFLALIVRLVVYFKPFRVFVFPSITLFLAGFIFLLYEIIYEGNVAEFPIILITSGLILGSIGLLADLIVKTRKSE